MNYPTNHHDFVTSCIINSCWKVGQVGLCDCRILSEVPSGTEMIPRCLGSTFLKMWTTGIWEWHNFPVIDPMYPLHHFVRFAGSNSVHSSTIESTYIEGTYSMLQGPILGPLLFLVYVNDLVNDLHLSIDPVASTYFKLTILCSVYCVDIHVR